MKKNISLVLSGGAARGLAHIGVIEELEKHNFKITSIAGNSMGAFIGAVYVMGKLPEFKEWIVKIDKKDVFKFIDFSFSNQGFIKGNKIFNKMKSFFPDINIEDIKIPYVAVAADIKNMKEKIFTTGSLYKAVRASISVPAIFTPVKDGDAVLVDGGVVNPVPVNRAVRTENDMLFTSYVNADIPYVKNYSENKEHKQDKAYKLKIKEFRSRFNKALSLSKENKEKLKFFSLMSKSANLLTHRLSVMSIEKYQPDVLINISRYTAGYFDFFKAEELINAGREATLKRITENFKNS